MERRILGSTLQRGSFGLAVLLALAAPVRAVDGVVDINQARALAGGVTTGDTAGFPVTISQVGSYRLTGNLTVPDANTTAISVTADNVTIDLNGFTILGPTLCSGVPKSCTPIGTGEGIDAFSASANNVNVLNGTIRGMGIRGITLNGITGGRVDGVTTQNNGGFGIQATIVTNSRAFDHAGGGIVGAEVVTNSMAFGNGGVGIEATTVTNSNAQSNGGIGISATTVTNSTAKFNGGGGISSRTAANCTSFGNSGAQITTAGVTGQNICGPAFTPCP